ncbi:MAG: methyltransferase domain-containing protein [Nocardioides sp.]
MDDHHYLIRGGIEGRERLRVLGRVMRPSTLPLLERAGVAAGMRCLDVGCGGGDVTLDLASLVGLTGRAVGIDVDQTKVRLARAEAEQVAVTNVEFRVGDLTEGLGEEEYDVVYARFVLTHLADPAGAITEMHRVLRPGGRVVLEDIDFGGCFCEPPSADFERYREIYEESARANGGDPRIALRLPALVVAAGFGRVQPHVVQHAALEGESKVMPALTLENIRSTALHHTVATDEEIDRLVDVLYALAREPTTYLSNPRMVQVIGEKV